MQLRAGELGVNRKEPGAGARFEHEVVGRDRRRHTGDDTEFDRRRELLERLALFGVGRCGADNAHRWCKLRGGDGVRALLLGIDRILRTGVFRISEKRRQNVRRCSRFGMSAVDLSIHRAQWRSEPARIRGCR